MLASKECDRAIVFVSTSDRARPGEVPITGADMSKIWHEFIEPTLPNNVTVTYGGSPVANAYKALGDANEGGSKDEYVLYGDPQDLETNFPRASLIKYAGNLYEAGQVTLRAVDRASTVDISGTRMRSFLEKGDRASFVKYLPSQIDRDAVWSILYATTKNPPKVKATQKARKPRRVEGLLRAYIRTVLQG
jgi:hypothetical protein